MNTLSTQALNNLKVIRDLGNDSILSSSSSRDIAIQEEFVEVDNINDLENGLHFTFHQALSDMVTMRFVEKDVLIDDIDECIQNIYDNKILNGLMKYDTELYKIMDDIDIKHNNFKEACYYGSPFYHYYGKFSMIKDYVMNIIENPPSSMSASLYRYLEEYRNFNYHLKPLDFSDDENSDDENSDENSDDESSGDESSKINVGNKEE